MILGKTTMSVKPPRNPVRRVGVRNGDPPFLSGAIFLTAAVRKDLEGSTILDWTTKSLTSKNPVRRVGARNDDPLFRNVTKSLPATVKNVETKPPTISNTR
jgi:hypothetical protein